MSKFQINRNECEEYGIWTNFSLWNVQISKIGTPSPWYGVQIPKIVDDKTCDHSHYGVQIPKIVDDKTCDHSH